MTLGPSPGGRENVSEIQIECEHNSALCHGFRRDLGIGKTDESFVAEMDRFMISRAQRIYGRERYAHVGQESQAAGLLKNPICSFASAAAH